MIVADHGIFNIPDVTERTGTVEAGSDILAGVDPDWVLCSMWIALD